MTANIEVYTFEDKEGNESDYSTQDYQEAEEYAKEYGYMIIANIYEWQDSELVKDYTPISEGVKA